MTRTIVPLTEPEHREIARILSRIRNGLELELGHALYPRRKGPGYAHWSKAVRQINRLRTRLDNLFFNQFPRGTSYYYGSDERVPFDGDAAAYARALYGEFNTVREMLNGRVLAPVLDNLFRIDGPLWALLCDLGWEEPNPTFNSRDGWVSKAKRASLIPPSGGVR